MAWQIYKRVWEYELAPSDKLVALALEIGRAHV